MNISQTQAVQAFAGALKQDAPNLEPVPHERVAQMVGEAILGGFVALVGLVLLGVALKLVLAADKIEALSFALIVVGLGVFFTGAVFISKKLLATMLNVVRVGRAVKATLKGAPPEPPSA